MFVLRKIRWNDTLKHSNTGFVVPIGKGKRGKGFGALSKRFDVAKSVIETWHEKWVRGGRTPDAFEDEAGDDHRSILTSKEKERHILDYVSLKNAKREPVDYPNVHKNVGQTNKERHFRKERPKNRKGRDGINMERDVADLGI